MIPKARIASWDLKPGEVAGEISLHGLYKRMQSTKVHRIPILNESGAVLYVVHDSTIAGFAGAADPSDDSFEKTMAELLGHPEFGKFIEAIAFVGPDAVLADARAAMRSVERCNDVFVTTSGQKADPILGWLTNTDLAGLE
jgi:tripartite-type tricarboxylate transporter receptor subunit TctC